MTIGGIAAIIAAIAFVALVIFIGVFLMHLVKTLGSVNQSLEEITKDVNDLSQETDNLLNNINAKLDQVDPVFQAAANLGTTVSNVTETAKVTSDSFKRRMESLSKVSFVGSAMNTISKLFSKKDKEDKKEKKNKQK